MSAPWQSRLTRTGWLWRYLRAEWALFGGGAVCLALTHVCSLAVPWVLSDAVETLRTRADANLAPHIALMLLAAVGAATVRTASRTLIYAGGREIEFKLRNDVVKHLLRLPLPTVRAGRVGDLLARAQEDTSEIRALSGPGFLNVTNTVMAYISTACAMVALDPGLTLVAMAPWPLLGFLFHRLSGRMATLNAALQRQLGDLSARLSESLSGAMVVKCHGLEQREVGDLAARSQAYLDRQLEFTLIRSTLWPMVFLLSGLGMVALLAVGGAHVHAGKLPLGSLVAFTSYYAYLLWPTVGIGWILTSIQRGFAAADRVHELWVAPPEEPTDLVSQGCALDGSSSAASCGRPVASSLDVRNLDYAYPIDNDLPRPVLADLSLELKPGLFALMGRTGSGKTTLLALLARVLPLPPGVAWVDGEDLALLPLATVRRSVVLVPQEPYLFSQTVLENLRWAVPSADEAAAREAARVAGLAGDIERLPDRYQARVGEAGVTLSRGQRQRMGLARALLADPPVLLLDDPFSAVDTHTEEEILRALVARRQGKVTLLVTHRVSTASLAGRIHVLDRGTIAEAGTADELLARRGLFHELSVKQRIDPEAEL